MVFVILGAAKVAFAGDCPNYQVLSTPFGVSVDVSRKAFIGCTWKEEKPNPTPIERIRGSNVLRLRRVATQYRRSLTWWMGSGSLPRAFVKPVEVRCKCWKSIESMRLYFRKDDTGTRLLGVEKKLKGISGTLENALKDLGKSVSKRMRRKPRSLTDKYRDGPNNLHTRVAIWKQRREHFILVAIDMFGPSVYSLGLSTKEMTALARQLRTQRQGLQKKIKEKNESRGLEL